MEKKSKIFMIVGVVVLVIAIVGSTLAYYVWTTSSDEETKIVSKVGAATIKFDGGSSIENASLRPVSDKTKGIVKEIKMVANTTGIKANLYLDIVSIDEELKNTTFKFFLAKSSTAAGATKEGNFSAEYLTSNTVTCTTNSTNHIVLLSDFEVPTSQVTYILYIWIDGTVDNDSSMMSKSFSFKLHADGTGGIIREAALPDGTGLVEGSLAEQLVTTYINANKTPANNNGIKYLQDTSNNLSNDIEGNIRYYGANPNNYIYFNCDDYSNQTSDTCEVWRIIGVFEGKVKIMRESQIGTYAWDNKNASTGAESAYGKNDWTTARLMKLLNPSDYYEVDSNDNGNGQSLYWNGQSGTCFSGQNNATKSCNFTSTSSTKGLKNDDTRNMISETMWYLRGWDTTSVYVDQMYEYERTTGEVYNTKRPTSWTGKIALAYPSDYGYAADLSVCQKQLGSYNDATCTANNWMKSIITNNGNNYGWLLTPNSGNSYAAWYVNSSGGVYYYGNNTYNACGVGPVLYLNSELGIKSGGDGSSSAPYQLSA